MNYELKTITADQKRQFELEGYFIAKGLFHAEEVEQIKDEFERISHTTVPGYFEQLLDDAVTDPLRRYPRVMHPHRFNELTKNMMLHAPVIRVLEDLFEEDVLATQSMYYYKPPGSRGQALHQDNFYLKVEPGNCIAARTAIDPADEENGGLLVVPKTSQMEMVCPEQADRAESFTTHFVKPPIDTAAVPAVMDVGDVLFFNGNLIHGSYRNKSKDRFRRSFICHYANASAASIHSGYRPLFRADGSEVMLEANPYGGPCGFEFAALYPH